MNIQEYVTALEDGRRRKAHAEALAMHQQFIVQLHAIGGRMLSDIARMTDGYLAPIAFSVEDTREERGAYCASVTVRLDGVSFHIQHRMNMTDANDTRTNHLTAHMPTTEGGGGMVAGNIASLADLERLVRRANGSGEAQ